MPHSKRIWDPWMMRANTPLVPDLAAAISTIGSARKEVWDPASYRFTIFIITLIWWARRARQFARATSRRGRSRPLHVGIPPKAVELAPVLCYLPSVSTQWSRRTVYRSADAF